MPITSTFVVEINGQPLSDDVVPLLTTAHVDDSQRLPDLFVLRFRDGDRIVVAKTGVKIGSQVKVSVLTSETNSPQPLIVGEVTALEAEFGGGGTFTVIRGYDPAHRLFRGRRTDAYTQMTASDIATQVARRAGIKVGSVEATTTVFDHVSQFGSTDWEFLEGLAREVGHEISVRDGAFGFTKPQQAKDAPDPAGRPGAEPLVLRLGADLLRFRSVVTAAQQVAEVEVRGWDVPGKEALKATAPAATHSATLPDTDPKALADVFGGARYVSTDVPYRTQAEVDSVAASLAEEVAGAFAELEGVVRGNPAVRAGAAVSIVGLGSPFDGKYTVTTSRHRFEPGSGYTTAFSVSGRAERSLFSLASGGSGGRRTPGVVPGIVTDVADPQKIGRVKVKLPWLSDSYASAWARTVQQGAGKDRGWMVLPEVGDEVLVAFEQGDARSPYVLGGLYNGVDTPKTHAPDPVDSGTGAVNRRSMVSRLGHRIDLLDKSGSDDGVLVETKDAALSLRLDAAKTAVTVHSDGTVVIEGSKGITVDAASADLDLKAGTISLKATGGVTVDGGGGDVTVKSGAALALNGTTAKLEGSAATEVKGGATCSISAALVKIN